MWQWLWTMAVLNFNPHSREGSDKEWIRGNSSVLISIHTPAKGVTLRVTPSKNKASISIHTPAKGVTKKCLRGVYMSNISIHTPAKGVTPLTRVW